MSVNFGLNLKLPRRLSNALGFLVFALACLFFIIFCAVCLAQRSGITFAETEGVIVDITSDYIGEEQQHYVYVDYTADGIEYNNVRYNEYNAWMKIGDTVTVNYNVENPTQIESPSSTTWFIVIIIISSIGLLFFLWKAFKAFVN